MSSTVSVSSLIVGPVRLFGPIFGPFFVPDLAPKWPPKWSQNSYACPVGVYQQHIQMILHRNV